MTLVAIAASVSFSAFAQDGGAEPSTEDWPFACVPPDFSAVGKIFADSASTSGLALQLIAPSPIRIPVIALSTAAAKGTLLVPTEASKKAVLSQWELFQRYRMKLKQGEGQLSRDVVAVHCPARL